MVNRWYSAFPDSDGSFARRIKSEKDTEHYQALDELYVHDLLHQQHDDVRYEEGSIGPDFRLYRGRQSNALPLLKCSPYSNGRTGL